MYDFHSQLNTFNVQLLTRLRKEWNWLFNNSLDPLPHEFKDLLVQSLQFKPTSTQSNTYAEFYTVNENGKESEFFLSRGTWRVNVVGASSKLLLVCCIRWIIFVYVDKNEQLVVLLLKIMLSTLSNNVVESESACLCYAASSQFLARY